MRYFGFYTGSPDPYNKVQFEFYNSNQQLVKTFTGTNLFNGDANGDWSTGRYVNFWADAGDSINSIRMYSDGIAFETDNHAYAAPDGGLTLMLLGGVLVGLEALRRRFRA